MLTAEKLFARTVTTSEGCMEWQGAIGASTGYGKVRYNGKPVDTHRASWMLTNGAIPPRMDICHKCDNRKCVNPEHLFLGTRSDNMRDARDKGRLDMTKALENHPYAIPDEAIVEAARLIDIGLPNTEIAALCGMNRRTVSLIKYRSRPRYARLLGEVA